MNYKKVLLLCALCISVCGMSVSASESETAESETVSSETSFPPLPLNTPLGKPLLRANRIGLLPSAGKIRILL